MPVAVVMSKKFQSIRRILGVLGLTLQFFTFAAAQDLVATVKIDEFPMTKVEVSGKFTSPRPSESHVLVFLDSIAGIGGLSKRLSNVRAFDAAGVELQLIREPQCCFATDPIASWSYTVDLKAPDNLRGEGHTSWLRDGAGLLMLDDLLPQEFVYSGRKRPASVEIRTPDQWKVFTTEEKVGKIINVTDISSSVILVGRNWNETVADVRGHSASLLSSGDFLFTREESFAAARPIIEHYVDAIGSLPSNRLQIALVRASSVRTFGEWEADTRGSTVFIASSDMAFKAPSLQRLNEQFRHELFHLWIPNGVALKGRYDWFYEGFALYSSLRLAVSYNTIRFDDMLDTLSRAVAATPEHANRVGLVELAKRRFNGSERQMYSQGLVFAFLCDLALNISSKGKRNSDTLVRDLYRQYKTTSVSVDGTDAVIKMLLNHAELRPLVDQYVIPEERRDQKALINAASLFENAGLELSTVDGRAKLIVKPKLSSRQKEILDKLGYNSWRKLVKDSK